mgnify:CR=1 FL=1
MNKKLKVGIIGCGGIANSKHMPGLKSVEEAEMVAFCDLEIERAEKAKAAAENKLRENASQKEFERAEQKLRRAMNRLVVAGKK